VICLKTQTIGKLLYIESEKNQISVYGNHEVIDMKNNKRHVVLQQVTCCVDRHVKQQETCCFYNMLLNCTVRHTKCKQVSRLVNDQHLNNCCTI
jgi:hypothetical protein